MYCKRILILQQTDSRFAQRNLELCGMVKLVGGDSTQVTVFVTNANVDFGQWWILLNLDGAVYAHNLQTLNNEVFVLPRSALTNVACLLVKKEDQCFEAACSQYGRNNLLASLRRNMSALVAENNDQTAYEQFVASTQNFYEGVDVSRLKAASDARYKSVSDYSTAFERFYATGGNVDYYQSVKKEIARVFTEFPPYYPLIRKYGQSFFVRIDFPSSDKYFVLGVLQQRGIVRYICYGLPAEKEGFSDKDFVYVENQPVNFWMLFQDAETGQIATLNV